MKYLCACSKPHSRKSTQKKCSSKIRLLSSSPKSKKIIWSSPEQFQSFFLASGGFGDIFLLRSTKMKS